MRARQEIGQCCGAVVEVEPGGRTGDNGSCGFGKNLRKGPVAIVNPGYK